MLKQLMVSDCPIIPIPLQYQKELKILLRMVSAFSVCKVQKAQIFGKNQLFKFVTNFLIQVPIPIDRA